jgi:hypothetical protein
MGDDIALGLIKPFWQWDVYVLVFFLSNFLEIIFSENKAEV